MGQLGMRDLSPPYAKAYSVPAYIYKYAYSRMAKVRTLKYTFKYSQTLPKNSTLTSP